MCAFDVFDMFWAIKVYIRRFIFSIVVHQSVDCKANIRNCIVFLSGVFIPGSIFLICVQVVPVSHDRARWLVRHIVQEIRIWRAYHLNCWVRWGERHREVKGEVLPVLAPGVSKTAQLLWLCAEPSFLSSGKLVSWKSCVFIWASAGPTHLS